LEGIGGDVKGWGARLAPRRRARLTPRRRARLAPRRRARCRSQAGSLPLAFGSATPRRKARCARMRLATARRTNPSLGRTGPPPRIRKIQCLI